MSFGKNITSYLECFIDSDHMSDKSSKELLDFFLKNGAVSRQEISDKSDLVISPATLKRYLSELQNDGLIQSEGKGKATVYKTTPHLELTYPIDLNSYFLLEQDERKIRNQFDLEIFSKLKGLFHCISI